MEQIGDLVFESCLGSVVQIRRTPEHSQHFDPPHIRSQGAPLTFFPASVGILFAENYHRSAVDLLILLITHSRTSAGVPLASSRIFLNLRVDSLDHGRIATDIKS